MDGRFGFRMHGWAEVERTEQFNQRWNRLVRMHHNLLNDFVCPVVDSGKLTSSESSELEKRLLEMKSWFDTINADVNNARQNDLARYATSLRNVALEAIRSCKKYGVYEDIQSVEYRIQRKMIILNGKDLYFIG